MLIHNIDEIEFVTKFPYFLGHPVHQLKYFFYVVFIFHRFFNLTVKILFVEVRRIEEEGPTGLKEKIITLLIDRSENCFTDFLFPYQRPGILQQRIVKFLYN